MLTLCLQAHAAEGYVINGNVSDVPDGTMLYLRLVGPPNKDIDSTRIENGRFRFTGNHEGTPEWALISIKGAFTPICDFYLENGDINISGQRFMSKASGTETNRQYTFYVDSINSMHNAVYGLRTNIAVNNDNPATVDSLKAQLKDTEALLLDKEVKFVQDYPDSPVSLRIVEYISRNASSDDVNRYVSFLSDTQQASPEAKSLLDYAIRKKKTENGAVAPQFTLKDINGNTVSLSDYKGKYILIDFWASWCSPCRASFPKVKGIYEKYAGDRFDILGVSLDRSDKAWRKAVAEEDCPWIQVVDAEGTVGKDYAISTIPRMILISPDGRICEYSSLEDKLSELFDK